jgi:hypothetical protein
MEQQLSRFGGWGVIQALAFRPRAERLRILLSNSETTPSDWKARPMLTILVSIAIIPFALMADWFGFLAEIADPREAQLTRASHGMMMVIGAVLVWRYDLYPHEYPEMSFMLLAFVAAWGVFWFILGATRSHFGYRDGRLIGRYVAKIALGAGIYLWLLPQWEINDTAWRLWVYEVGVGVAIWCVVTGTVKLLLILRPPPPPPKDPPSKKVHGDADFSGGEGLSG